MSRDLSLNKIAPHLTSSSVRGVDRTNPIPEFSPYAVEAEEKFSEDKDQEKKKTGNDPGTEEPPFAERYPEIFKLIEIPDFSELFQLAVGEEDAQLMVIIKDIRGQRGVTELLPVCQAKEAGSKETLTYQHTIEWFTNKKGNQFAGKM